MDTSCTLSTPTQPSSPDERGTVFLSIVIYRRYRSLPLLGETLLVLSGQTCSDFEILIATPATDTPDDGAARSLTESPPPSTRERTRLLPPAGKTRAQTLNHALEHARGCMVSFVDEGDLPFDNWVEALKETALRSYPSIAFAYSIEQVWELGRTKDGACLLRSVGKPDPSSCRPFDVAAFVCAPEFRGASFAFPLDAPNAEPLRFDESLCALERWDYLMRSLDVFPLSTFDRPASLTRLWRRPTDPQMRPSIWDETVPLPGDAEPSEALCREERDRIVERLAASAPRTSALYDPHAPGLEEAARISRQTFSQRCRLTCHPADGNEPFEMLPDIGHRCAWTLRFTFDPSAAPLERIELCFEGMPGCLTLSDFACSLEDVRGEEFRFDLAACDHNGLQIDCSHAVFLVERPTLSLRLAAPARPARIHVKLEGRPGVNDEHVDQFARGTISLWAGRMKRWALRRVNRL